jgi:hypothetical protein
MRNVRVGVEDHIHSTAQRVDPGVHAGLLYPLLACPARLQLLLRQAWAYISGKASAALVRTQVQRRQLLRRLAS